MLSPVVKQTFTKLKSPVRLLRDRVQYGHFKLQNRGSNKERFECPVCEYEGPFIDLHPATGLRKHAKCPYCGAFERHRLQFLVIKNVLRGMKVSEMKMLHFAPERCFRRFFRNQFGTYETADLNMTDVDFNVDIRDLPFGDASYDFVLASIVLDYVPDDSKAIREIRRILTPNGIAVLPVSVVCQKTVEYSEANPYESHHVRASGMDYFERFEKYFSKVEKISSDSLPKKYQLFIYEDRSVWPTKECPLRPGTPGKKHPDIVPVCYV
jgi:SAM-dependent methyltransferase